MKNKITFLSLIMLFCLVACSKRVTDKTIQVNPKTAKEPVNIPITKIEDNLPKTPTIVNSIPKDMDSAIVVSLKRSPCFGKCPVFTIQLFYI